MVAKPFTVLIYAISGLLIAVWPIIVQWALQSDCKLCRAFRSHMDRRRFFFTALSGPYAWPLGLGVGLLIGPTLIWWRSGFAEISILEAGVYAIIVVLSSVLLAREALHSPSKQRSAAFRCIPVSCAISICLFLSFSTGIMNPPAVMLTAWHHWSAFIGPSELMLSGARIFYDFPAQYGLGATTLIAAACGHNCALGMHYVVAVTSLFFGLAVLYVVASSKVRSPMAGGVLFAIVIFTCYFWDAYPPMVSSPREAPSVSGLRFLPAISLIVGLLWIEQSRIFVAHWSRIGHVIYIFGALWSPESLFFVTYVWWPYYIWRRCAEAPFGMAPSAIMRATLTLLIIFIIGLIGFVGAYRILYGAFPSASAYLAYMLYPPGELPIDPRGPIWFSVSALFLGLLLVSQLLLAREKQLPIHRSLLVLLLGYATLSYCMGRGHSNNFLNLLPFTVMILVGVFKSQLPILLRAISAGMLVSLLGWSSVFGWTAWTSTIESRTLFEFRPNEFVSSFSYQRPESATAVVESFKHATAVEDFSSISNALAKIRENSQDPISVVDGNYLLLANTEPEAWSAYHGPGNVYFMPREWRRNFLRNTRDRLDRSGWLIIFSGFPAEWLEDFQSAYEATESWSSGSYRVIHFKPRK
ncbi:MAG: hypothetical protein JWR80_7364 [Bradyrhizobium sp.]|nr:hypothetical protein [Bradyrhizobium sp.]